MKKGILIDVNNRTVTEVEVTKDNRGSQLESIYGHIKCDCFDVVSVDEKNDVYVDDNGLLNLRADSMFFLYKGYPQPLAGNGLVMGIDHNTGDSVDTTLTVEEVKNNVKFMDMMEVQLMLGRQERTH